MPKPWNVIPIVDSGEPLVSLPSSVYCLEPHPYFSLGAPYTNSNDPWKLRLAVIDRLLNAQENLYRAESGLKLAVFDAWRSVEVQSFMVQHVVQKQCQAKGLDISDQGHSKEIDKIKQEVNRFWALPSTDKNQPPPHSTGSAVDLTLADLEGSVLDMGSPIDEIGSISNPDYFESIAHEKDNSDAFIWNKRRKLLSNVMKEAGFVQHPNEWWHFSYGDQMWAWLSKSDKAIYGLARPMESNSSTF